MSGQFEPQTQQMQPAWVVYQQAQQLFEIRDLGTSFTAVPDEVSLLWVVQPKNLSNATQYAIDQFVMRGGKALIFVDPLAAVDAAPIEGMPQGAPPMGQPSDFAVAVRWLGYRIRHQGCGSGRAACTADQHGFRRPGHAPLGYLGITPDRMSSDDIITADLSVINAAMPGQLRLCREQQRNACAPLCLQLCCRADAGVKIFILARPGHRCRMGLLPAESRSPLPGGSAARYRARSRRENRQRHWTPMTRDNALATNEHIAVSTEPVNLIVVADVDMLSDPMWVQVQNFFGQQIATAFASNGAFVVNALENLAGSSDLIAVRSRGSFSRPFLKVEELRVGADARYRETEQRLQQELAETERRLGELQSSREDTGSLLLSEEQQAEIDRFVDQRTSIRKELRAVQRGLDKDIEDLGGRLKAINIGLVPVLLTLAILFAAWRRRQKGQP